ncbi:MAG TPA: hypothetical protein VLW84_01700 [Terriglobales bacterium]|nr:hypothetical protein [Terriglobales bacterium]
MNSRLAFQHLENFFRLKQEIRKLARAKRGLGSLYLAHNRKPVDAHAAIMENAYLMQLRLHLESLVRSTVARDAP